MWSARPSMKPQLNEIPRRIFGYGNWKGFLLVCGFELVGLISQFFDRLRWFFVFRPIFCAIKTVGLLL